MQLRPLALSVLLLACGDDPSPTPDTTLASDTPDTASETVVADTSPTEATTTDTTDTDIADTSVPDTSAPDACTCVAPTRDPVYADMPAGTYDLEVEGPDGVSATRPDITLAAGHVYTFVHAGTADDALIAVHDEPLDPLPAGQGRLVVGHFDDTLGPITTTFGRQTATPIAPAASARFEVHDDVPLALTVLHTAPGVAPTVVSLAPDDAALTTVVVGLTTATARTAWAPLDAGAMGLRAHNDVGPAMRLYVGCSSPGACADEAAAGAALELGTSSGSDPTTLERWRILPASTTVRVIGLELGSGTLVTDTTVTLARGTHHTLVYFMRADGQAIWQDFASDPAPTPVVDVLNAQAPFGLTFRVDELVGTTLAPRTFSAHGLRTGPHVVSFYAGTPDFVGASATPFATSLPFVFDGRVSLVLVRDDGTGHHTLQDNGSAMGPGSGVRMLIGCAVPGTPTCTFFAATPGDDCNGTCGP